jgi:hypothetical protein
MFNVYDAEFVTSTGSPSQIKYEKKNPTSNKVKN